MPLSFGAARAAKFSLNVDNLTDERDYDRETTDNGHNGQYLKAVVGAGRAVYGSVSIYF